MLEYLRDTKKLHKILAARKGKDVDPAEMRARRAALMAQKDELATLFADGVLDGPAVRRESGKLAQKIGALDAALADLARRTRWPSCSPKASTSSTSGGPRPHRTSRATSSTSWSLWWSTPHPRGRTFNRSTSSFVGTGRNDDNTPVPFPVGHGWRSRRNLRPLSFTPALGSNLIL